MPTTKEVLKIRELGQALFRVPANDADTVNSILMEIVEAPLGSYKATMKMKRTQLKLDALRLALEDTPEDSFKAKRIRTSMKELQQQKESMIPAVKTAGAGRKKMRDSGNPFKGGDMARNAHTNELMQNPGKTWKQWFPIEYRFSMAFEDQPRVLHDCQVVGFNEEDGYNEVVFDDIVDPETEEAKRILMPDGEIEAWLIYIERKDNWRRVEAQATSSTRNTRQRNKQPVNPETWPWSVQVLYFRESESSTHPFLTVQTKGSQFTALSTGHSTHSTQRRDRNHSTLSHETTTVPSTSMPRDGSGSAVSSSMRKCASWPVRCSINNGILADHGKHLCAGGCGMELHGVSCASEGELNDMVCFYCFNNLQRPTNQSELSGASAMGNESRNVDGQGPESNGAKRGKNSLEPDSNQGGIGSKIIVDEDDDDNDGYLGGFLGDEDSADDETDETAFDRGGQVSAIPVAKDSIDMQAGPEVEHSQRHKSNSTNHSLEGGQATSERVFDKAPVNGVLAGLGTLIASAQAPTGARPRKGHKVITTTPSHSPLDAVIAKTHENYSGSTLVEDDKAPTNIVMPPKFTIPDRVAAEIGESAAADRENPPGGRTRQVEPFELLDQVDPQVQVAPPSILKATSAYRKDMPRKRVLGTNEVFLKYVPRDVVGFKRNVGANGKQLDRIKNPVEFLRLGWWRQEGYRWWTQKEACEGGLADAEAAQKEHDVDCKLDYTATIAPDHTVASCCKKEVRFHSTAKVVYIETVYMDQTGRIVIKKPQTYEDRTERELKRLFGNEVFPREGVPIKWINSLAKNLPPTRRLAGRREIEEYNKDKLAEVRLVGLERERLEQLCIDAGNDVEKAIADVDSQREVLTILRTFQNSATKTLVALSKSELEVAKTKVADLKGVLNDKQKKLEDHVRAHWGGYTPRSRTRILP